MTYWSTITSKKICAFYPLSQYPTISIKTYRSNKTQTPTAWPLNSWKLCNYLLYNHLLEPRYANRQVERLFIACQTVWPWSAENSKKPHQWQIEEQNQRERRALIGAASTPTFCVRMTGPASKQRDYIVRA